MSALGRAVDGARHVGTILRKDLLVELRTKEVLLTMGLFAVLTVVIFSFAFYVDDDRARAYAPGILWVTVIFSGTLGLNRLFDREQENDCMSALMLSSAGPKAIFLAKSLGNLLFTLVMELLTVPLILLFFDLSVDRPALLLLVLLAGTVGFCFVGTLFAAMLVRARMKEVLLPLVVYPVVVPVIIGGVKATSGILNGYPTDEVVEWARLLLAFDLVFVVLSVWLFERMWVE
ncbi:MAG: hypothetical protein AMXMBFR64_14260 [Myxococcales bacterium]